MLTVEDVLERIARVQANDDARQLIEEALAADPPVTASTLGQGKDALFFLAQIRANMNVDRLNLLIPSSETSLYRATYIKWFLLAARQGLLAHLCQAALPYPPQEAAALAQEAVQSLEESLLVLARQETSE